METKQWFMSKGVWGGIVAGLAAVAGLFGYNVPADAQADLINWIVGIAGAGGALLAIWGRIKAAGPIK